MFGAAGPGHAELFAPPAVAPGMFCRTAVAAAERANGIPTSLLAAIARVESGRRDPVGGGWHPWPWAVNAEGQGYFYETKAEAVAAVRAMQARGMRSIDVGCGQINLMHHPNAFPSLEVAFDPPANAAYAGKFLRDLFAQTGDWNRATGMYHSATPELGADYLRKVLAMWPEEQRQTGLVAATPLARAWEATMAPTLPGMIRVIRMSPSGASPAPRIIMLPTANGEAPPGRGLDAYRASPVGLAFQPPPRRAGG